MGPELCVQLFAALEAQPFPNGARHDQPLQKFEAVTKALISKFEFHPVGQGLFCSGELFSLCDTSISNPRNLFRWVYDCGTSSKRSLLDEAIDQAFTAPLCKQETEPTIDLLVISHFDKDHISGLPKLLNNYTDTEKTARIENERTVWADIRHSDATVPARSLDVIIPAEVDHVERHR